MRTSLDPRLREAAMDGLSAQATEQRKEARERSELDVLRAHLGREAFAMPEPGMRAENEMETERDPRLARLSRVSPALGLAGTRTALAKAIEPEEIVMGAAGSQPYGKRTGLPGGPPIPPQPGR